MQFSAWMRQHENDPRTLLPAVAAQITARRSYSEKYGKRGAARMLTDATEAHTANVRRTRAVLMGIETIREKLAGDPSYSAKRANSDLTTLRVEYERLRADLPRLALRVEDARAADANPVDWAEAQFARFPALTNRLPTLPAL